MKYKIEHIVFLILMVIFSSCSSLRKGRDVDNAISQEKLFMESNFKIEYINEWERGKEFICVTDELPMLLEPTEGVRGDYSGLKNSKFIYKHIKENTTWKGIESNIVYQNGNSEFIYRVPKQVNEILSSDFVPLLPELVSVDDIVKADSLLRDTVLYIKTQNWYTAEGVEEIGKKLVPVTIKKVKAGNKIFPLSIIFTNDGGKEYMVYTAMQGSQYSTFDKLFTFSDPRQKHQQIKDDIWELITQSKVALGMTKNECQISLGLPNKVIQIPEYSGLRERWLYNTGTSLEFKDGLLIKFRLM